MIVTLSLFCLRSFFLTLVILSARVGYFNEYDAPKISYGLGVAFNVEERRLNLDFALVDNDKLGFVQLFSLEMTF